MSPVKSKQAGRVAVGIAENLKARIASGELGLGQYLPGVREIGRQHKVSPETARRAMKIMEAEKWVRVHPGHGFKVTAIGNDPERSAPVAFILSGSSVPGGWSTFGQQLLAAMYGAAEGRGWSLLGVSASDGRVADLVQELKVARASGLIIDSPNEALTNRLADLGVPAVLVEELAAGLDSVTQDNFGGALRAAGYLIGRGHRRLGWFGPRVPNVQCRERWAGAQAAVREGGAAMIGCDPEGADLEKSVGRLRSVLSGVNPPTAVLALWWNHAAAALRVVRELGLETEIVAWCPQEQVNEFRAACAGGRLPATMTWSIRELAETALVRMSDRRERPAAPTVRVSVSVKLSPPEELWEEGDAL